MSRAAFIEGEEGDEERRERERSSEERPAQPYDDP
jgi:hypothetical protein